MDTFLLFFYSLVNMTTDRQTKRKKSDSGSERQADRQTIPSLVTEVSCSPTFTSQSLSSFSISPSLAYMSGVCPISLASRGLAPGHRKNGSEVKQGQGFTGSLSLSLLRHRAEVRGQFCPAVERGILRTAETLTGSNNMQWPRSQEGPVAFLLFSRENRKKFLVNMVAVTRYGCLVIKSG